MFFKTQFIVALFLSFTFAVNGQITKGEVNYDAYFSSDDAQVSQWVEQIENSSFDIFFSENHIRTEMIMGNFMTMISISAKDKDSSLILMDSMMGKYAFMKSNNSETEQQQNQRLIPEDAKVEITEETKKIIGYTCKKAIITTENAETIIWFTEKIVPVYKDENYFSERIPGLPLEIHTNFSNFKVKFVAYKFKDKLKNEAELFSFELPKGYNLKTQEELLQMQNGRMR